MGSRQLAWPNYLYFGKEGKLISGKVTARRQPRGKLMVSLARIGWHLWEIGLRFALNSTPGWKGQPFSRVLAMS